MLEYPEHLQNIETNMWKLDKCSNVMQRGERRKENFNASKCSKLEAVFVQFLDGERKTNA
jgi:hypothetical protein